ncbi:hypothetical protein ACIOJE_09475 [Kitasatospora sp. NPDC087861]|uniref:hypothetical protein n=1 Tax=Kitasatospora sp. NPDC087861 TaxID=3364070 RepID=UPI0038091C23
MTDELALDYDHAFRVVGHLVGAGRLDYEVVAELRAIDAVLCRMGGRENAERWSKDALSTDPGWNEVREKARRVLVCLIGGWRLPMPEIRVVR